MDDLVRPRHDRGAVGLRCGSCSGKIDILCDVQRSGGFDVSSRVYQMSGIAAPRFRTRSARVNGVLECFGFWCRAM